MAQDDFEDSGRFNGANEIPTIPFRPVETPQNVIDYRSIPTHEFLYDAFNGVGGFLGLDYTYLTNDRTENFFNTRKKMTHYINDLIRYVTAQYDRVYSAGWPKYDKTTDAGLLSMIKDIDRRGSSIDGMKKYATSYCLLDGTVFLASGNDGTKGKQPWVIVYTAVQFDKKLSAYDDFGNVVMYVFKIGNNKYHVYTPEQFLELEQKKNTEKVVLNDMEVLRKSDVPEQVVRPIYSIPHYGQGVLPTPQQTLSIARQSLNLLELRSRMIQLMTRQLFDRLVVSGGVDSAAEGMTNMLVLNGDNASAQLLSPDPNVTKVWGEIIGTFNAIMYEHMRDGGVIITKSSQIPESGASKAHTFQPVKDAYLRSIAIGEMLDAYTQDSFNLWSKKNATLEVTYNQEYEPEAATTVLDLKDYVEIAKTLELNELLKAVSTKVMEKLGVSEDSKVGKQIVAEILTMRSTLSE